MTDRLHPGELRRTREKHILPTERLMTGNQAA